MACQAAHAASARISLRQSEIDQLGGTRHLKIRFRQPPTNRKGSSPIRVSPNERDGRVFRPKIYEEAVEDIGVWLSLAAPATCLLLLDMFLHGSETQQNFDRSARLAAGA